MHLIKELMMMKTTMRKSIFSILSLFFIFFSLFISFNCKEDNPAIVDTVKAVKSVIEGPGSVITLSHQGTEIVLDGSKSVNASSYKWFREDVDSTIKSLGTGKTAVDTLFYSNTYTYFLIASNENEKADTASVSISASPAPSTNQIFAMYGVSGGFAKIDLVSLDPSDYSKINVLFEDIYNKGFTGDDFSKEPNGKRIAITKFSGNRRDLALYDVASGLVEVVLPAVGGQIWMVEWSPKGDLIAYSRDYRHPGYNGDEIGFLNVNTKESWYMTDSLNPFSEGLNPSWNPSGDELAVGMTLDENDLDYQGYKKRRIRIYSNFLNGNSKANDENIKRRKLNSDETLEKYFKDNYGLTPEQVSKISEGTNFVDWNPKGDLIAYFISGGEFSNGIAVAKTDGSGIQFIISSFPNYNGPYYLSGSWSPDGEKLLITGFMPRHLYIVNRDGSGFKDLTKEYGYENEFFYVTWGD